MPMYGPFHILQIRKADFEKHSRHSAVFKTLDKNRDGIVSAHELENKAEKAFRVSCSPQKNTLNYSALASADSCNVQYFFAGL